MGAILRNARRPDVPAEAMTPKQALYFGYKNGGHFLYLPGMICTYDDPDKVAPGFPWDIGLLDGGLLNNGKHKDIYDGRVFWTCGGKQLWLAFYWWDRSGDKRGASNSSFYVRGFDIDARQAAFDYAASIFPTIIARQACPLVLQP